MPGDEITWPVGSRVRVGAGDGFEAIVIEILPTYRVVVGDGACMVVEERQIQDGTRP